VLKLRDADVDFGDFGTNEDGTASAEYGSHKEIFYHFKPTHEHRVTGRSKHSLASILMIIFIATAAGCHGKQSIPMHALTFHILNS
jgi:hypothetical protein